MSSNHIFHSWSIRNNGSMMMHECSLIPTSVLINTYSKTHKLYRALASSILLYELPPITYSRTYHCHLKWQCTSFGRQAIPHIKTAFTADQLYLLESLVSGLDPIFLVHQTIPISSWHKPMYFTRLMPLIIAMHDMNFTWYMHAVINNQ